MIANGAGITNALLILELFTRHAVETTTNSRINRGNWRIDRGIGAGGGR
jgi:hypothetical protein